MKLSNKYNLPAAIVNAVTNDPYTSGNSDISVTRLIAPPQIVYLQKKHADEIEEDVSGRIWSLLGQSVHHVLERSASEDDIVEERFYSMINGWWLSGQCDLISENTLYDFKVTSAWSVLNGIKPEWENQLNVLHYLAEDSDINKLAIIAILRDWSETQMMRSSDYPRRQVVELEIPLWSKEKQEEYINKRIRLHQAAKGGDYPECTPEERWQKDDVWAVMREGRKSAVKLFDNQKDADGKAEELGGKHYVQYRKGESIRCGKYCSVASFCNQYKEMNDE